MLCMSELDPNDYDVQYIRVFYSVVYNFGIFSTSNLKKIWVYLPFIELKNKKFWTTSHIVQFFFEIASG